MRRPRVRFTIAGLMLLTLLVGVGLWYDRQARKRRSPSAAETEAQNRLQMVGLDLQFAEILLALPEPIPVYRPVDDSTSAQTRARQLESRADEVTRQRADEVIRQRAAEVARLRAAEVAARADYERERARRLSWW